MFIVALAMIQYAILLAIRYRQLDKYYIAGQDMDKNRAKICRKMDRYAIIFFTVVNLLTIGMYFVVYH